MLFMFNLSVYFYLIFIFLQCVEISQPLKTASRSSTPSLSLSGNCFYFTWIPQESHRQSWWWSFCFLGREKAEAKPVKGVEYRWTSLAGEELVGSCLIHWFWMLPKPKSMCLMFRKTKTQTSEFGVRKVLFTEKVLTEKMGGMVVPKASKRLGGTSMGKRWWGKF